MKTPQQALAEARYGIMSRFMTEYAEYKKVTIANDGEVLAFEVWLAYELDKARATVNELQQAEVM